jgi:hypothetical protein
MQRDRGSKSDGVVWAISRRDFFKLTGFTGASSMLGVGASGCNLEGLITNFETTLVRPEDLVVLRFEFVNLSRVPAAGGGEELVNQTPATAYIVVHFQSQHIFEEALHETAPPATVDMKFVVLL